MKYKFHSRSLLGMSMSFYFGLGMNISFYFWDEERYIQTRIYPALFLSLYTPTHTDKYLYVNRLIRWLR